MPGPGSLLDLADHLAAELTLDQVHPRQLGRAVA
jgi:hypothetical protein